MCFCLCCALLVRTRPALTANPWVAPLLPPLLRAGLPEDALSDDSESDTEDASTRVHPTMAAASSLFTSTAAAAAADGGVKVGRAAVPRVTSETTRDRARLALARKERAIGIDDARWLDRRLHDIDATIVDPALNFEYQCI